MTDRPGCPHQANVTVADLGGRDLNRTRYALTAFALACITATAAHAGPQEALDYFRKVEAWQCDSKPDTVGRITTHSRLMMQFGAGNRFLLLQQEGFPISRQTYERMIRMEGNVFATETGLGIKADSLDVESADPLPGLRNWPRPLSFDLELKPAKKNPRAYHFDGTSNTTQGKVDVHCIAHSFRK